LGIEIVTQLVSTHSVSHLFTTLFSVSRLYTWIVTELVSLLFSKSVIRLVSQLFSSSVRFSVNQLVIQSVGKLVMY